MKVLQNRVRRVRGQSAVMVSFLIMIVVMLIAFTTNLGKLVTEKIALQNAVDLAVYSGAATQAGYLNRMRSVNNQIFEIHTNVRRQMEPSRSPGIPLFFGSNICLPCAPISPPGTNITAPGAEAIIRTNKIMIEQALHQQFDALNRMAPQMAQNAARSAAEQNLRGASSVFQEKANGRSSNLLMPVKTEDVDWSYMGWTLTPCPPGPPVICRAFNVTEHKVKSWKFRDTSVRGEVMYAAGLENAKPNSNFLDGTYMGQFFSGNCRYGGGGSGRCAMSVYAAAHPHYGKLGSIPFQGGRTEERQWISMNGANNPMLIAPTGVERAQQLNPHRVFRGEYQDYRVRFIGIFESDARSLTGQSLRQLAGQYGNRMEH